MKTTIDHLVVVAPDLDTGCAFVTAALGVDLQAGGAHSRMGTHNRLLHLGPGLYLEVITVDPSAKRPDRPRWFGLDQLGPQSPARLATWVARTDAIHVARDACHSVVGDVEPMTRGTLSWQITLPTDGSLPMAGSAPTLIQWAPGPHPADMLQDKGCSLLALDVFHTDPEKIEALLTAMNFSGPVHLHALQAPSAPYLLAHIQTPYGLKTLPLSTM
ncbi:VOC family protein [Pseudomonas sp. Tri1]|uniref:VOC family protein n=1 Tax=Pseudomonas sp. Tri1 TaxID=2823875 RepID=UPI001B33920B|nr:VOC family protein [Pseudomonas sp. Tri1]